MNYTELKQKLVDDVLSKSAGMTEKEILERLTGGEQQLFGDEGGDGIPRLLRSVLRGETRTPDSPIMLSKKRRGTNTYKIRNTSQRPQRSKVKPDNDVDDTIYIGKCGEFAVLSELVAEGYNANIMAIDEGIDIVASRNNRFYYIQVKTTYFDEQNRCSFSIPVKNFDRVHDGSVVYIGVARGAAVGSFRFFVFFQQDLERLVNGRYVEQTASNINIKIAYDNSNTPCLYNGNQRTNANPYLVGYTNPVTKTCVKILG